jgi:hypothetical protein
MGAGFLYDYVYPITYIHIHILLYMYIVPRTTEKRQLLLYVLYSSFFPLRLRRLFGHVGKKAKKN